VDAVLDHARDPRYFGAGRENACDVLDVAHPLWLCTRQLGGRGGSDGGYRSAEIRGWAERQLTAALPRWQDGRGFGFGPGTAGPGRSQGCKGRRCGWPSSGCWPTCWGAPTYSAIGHGVYTAPSPPTERETHHFPERQRPYCSRRVVAPSPRCRAPWRDGTGLERAVGGIPHDSLGHHQFHPHPATRCSVHYLGA
jgi:hypothetical protein